LKVFLKDTVYRNAYFLIGAAWLFTLSFIFSNYWSYTSSPQGVKKTLEQYLQRQETDFNQFLQDSALITRLIDTKESEEEVLQIIEKKYGIFIYKLEDYGPIILKYWNTQQTLPTDEMLVKPEGEYLETLPNGKFEFIRRKLTLSGSENLLICALVPIRWDYFIENDYLRKGFVDQPNIEKNYLLSNSPTGISIENLKGNPLYYLDKKSASVTGGSDWVTILLRILGTMLILFYIHMFCLGMARRFGAGKAILMLVFLVVLLRIISYYFAIPLNYREFELFSPTIYGSNTILKTLGDLLINSLLFVWIILFSRSMINRYKLHLKVSKPVYRFIIAVIISAFLVAITWMSGFIIRSLVTDSSISYEVTNFFKLNVYSVVGFIVLSCVSMAYFILSHILFQYLEEVLPSAFLTKALLLSFIGLIYLTLSLNKQSISFDLGLLAWLIIYLSLVSWTVVQSESRISGSATVFWLVFFSASIAAIIFTENRNRELEIRKSAAVKLAIQADPSSDFLISITTQSLNNDFLRNNLSRFNDFYQSSLVKDSIINANFKGYANRFDTRLFLFDAAGNPLSSSDKLTYDTLNTIFTMQGKKTGMPDLRYYETDFTSFSYIFRKYVRDTSGQVIAQFYMLSNPRRYQSEALYPELIRQSNDLSFERWPSYAYAVYDSLQLKYSKNDYPFPISLETSDVPIQEYHNEVSNGYEVLWYKAGAGKVVIITRKSNFMLEAITLFAYLFCASLFLVGLFQLTSLILRSGFQWSLLRDLWQMSIRNQIYSTIIFISIFSFLVIGAATIIFFIQRYNKNNKDRLSRTIQVMSDELRDKLSDESSKGNLFNLYDSGRVEKMEEAISEISEIHNADINLYDEDGTLRISSQPFVYNKGILSRLMDPLAYYHMKRLRKSQYVQNEEYGQLKYLSIYTPFKSRLPEMKAYINIPYFASTMELKQEISNFLVAIINLNAFIFLMAGVIAVFITNRITQSFTWIGQKMQEVNLGKHNQEITWGKKDEIGGLVKEYNKMVHKLEDSAVALAKTEREGAWREMARQVAHEIKNPLTPMKLSMQYLQKAIDNNAPNVKELSSRVAGTLIEQIDHLSKIAAEFSQFANIGNTQNENIDLHELLQSLVSLHGMHEHINIQWIPIKQQIFIYADKTQINRLFTNLLQNAIEAIPEEQNGVINIREELVNDQVKIQIQDDGTGIPVDMQEKIFTPSFTTKTSGTGLGLAMSKGIVEQAKGEIWFETSVGKGTTFFITFPIVQPVSD
jgi:two-component system, NtrC family, nitrogen regulation sensor histidine kinase NtrY